MSTFTFKTKADAIYADASTCTSAVKAFQEYCESFTNKILAFTEGTDDSKDGYLSLSLPVDDLGHNKVCVISRQNYIDALNDEESEILVRINDVGSTIQTNGKDILSAVETSLSETKVQSEYLKLALQNIETKSSELVTNIASKFPGIAGNIIGKYQDLWDPADPMRSIQNLITSKNNQKITQNQDGSIEIFNPAEYGSADVWISAFQEIGDKIASFFEGIWRGITDLGGFFERLLDGVINLAKWLMGKAFGQLLTNYEAGGERVGLIDVPLIQIPIANINLRYDDNGYFMDFNGYGTNAYNQFPNPADGSGDISECPMKRTDSFANLISLIIHKATKYSEIHRFGVTTTLQGYDNTKMAREIWRNYGLNLSYITSKIFEFQGDHNEIILTKPLDIVIPTSNESRLFGPVTEPVIEFQPFDVCIRFAPYKFIDANHAITYLLMMQVYPMASWDTISVLPDKVTACHMWDTVYALGCYMYEHYWCLSRVDVVPPVQWSEAAADQKLIEFANSIIDISNINRNTWPDSSPDDLVSRLKLIDDPSLSNYYRSGSAYKTYMGSPLSSESNWTDVRVNASYIFLSLINYCGLCGPGFDNLLYEYNNAQYIKIIENDMNKLFYLYEIMPLSQVFPSTEVDWGFWPDVGDSGVYPVPLNQETGLSVYQDNAAAFTPYVTYNSYGTAVHYQKLSEQVAEAKAVIVAAIVAIVGVTLAILARKFLKNRQVKLELAQGYMDNYAWNLPANPSKQQIAEYTKARKKRNRISKLNGILGISSSSDSTNGLFSAIDSVKDQLLATQGANKDSDNNESITLKTIHHNIVG